MAVGAIYEFGPFRLDAGARRLTRASDELLVSARHFDVLVALVAQPGATLSKDALVEAAWRDVAVTDNSLEQAVSSLRRALGQTDTGEPYIQTVPRQGYRFVASVDTVAARLSDAALEAIIAPHRAWVEGRAALETLSADRMASAEHAFARILEGSPDDPVAHVGLANACVMRHEATRADATRDLDALDRAAHHALEACRLDPSYGEAWATHGFVADRLGHGDDARAALARALSLEPDNWRHHFRMGLVSWGEARLRSARRVVGLLPGFPLAHWLMATVHVARQSLDDAERELLRGIDAMQATVTLPAGHDAPRFPGVALEWLLGLICLARGQADEARRHFERELALESQGHLYSRESAANSWYAIGALHLHHGRRREAVTAFRETLTRVTRHPAVVALKALGEDVALGDAATVGPSVDKALGTAIYLAATGMHDHAGSAVGEALTQADAGSQLWWLPVEPVLRVGEHPAAWSAALAQLRNRAM